VGDVSSPHLAKTRMAKSVLDAGWGMLRGYLQYKGQQAMGWTPPPINGIAVPKWRCVATT